MDNNVIYVALVVSEYLSHFNSYEILYLYYCNEIGKANEVFKQIQAKQARQDLYKLCFLRTPLINQSKLLLYLFSTKIPLLENHKISDALVSKRLVKYF